MKKNSWNSNQTRPIVSLTTVLALTSPPFSAGVPNLDMVEGVDNEKVSNKKKHVFLL